MDELVRWFGEQLDADERFARATTERQPYDEWDAVGAGDDTDSRLSHWEVVGIATAKPTPAAKSIAEHIARHDPARVLRDIQSDRILLAAYASAQEALDAIAHPDIYDVGRTQGLEESVRYRALRFSSRDGYREDWRP